MITHCISTYNNLDYLKLAVKSVRKNSYYKDAPFIIHAENCTDGTDEWLKENSDKYQLEYYIDRVKTKFINFLHSDFYVAKDWDINLLKVHEQHKSKVWVFSQRIQPNIFREQSRVGTLVVPIDEFGDYHHNFNEEYFLKYAEELSNINDFEVNKEEGVSGLILKEDWDEIGGNDPLFAPASWDDKDIFLRAALKGYKFPLTSKSVVWHFGARGSHRLEENQGKTDARQIKAEKDNAIKWLSKWNKYPSFDKNSSILPEGMSIIDSYKENYK